MIEYQIKDKLGIVIGRFSNEQERDKAFEECIDYGFKVEEER